MDSSNKNYMNFTLQEWIDYTQMQHSRSIDMTLERIRQVWHNLNGKKPPLVITVGGTNGKGSCVSMLGAVLREAGMNVGCFTSPHLIRYNERIAINGNYASDAEICHSFCQIEQARGEITLTYFEYSTLNALLIFKQHHVDAVVLEVGMGGRLDSVNMIDNDIALITSIGLDHMQWLGNDIEQIGAEKAGIFRQNGLAVFADVVMPESISRIATERNTRLLRNTVDFSVTTQTNERLSWQSNAIEGINEKWREINDLPAPFKGKHQQNNLAGVVAVLSLLAPTYNIDLSHVRAGLAKATLAGRCQLLQSAPEIILDVAHNAPSVQELANFLSSQPVKPTLAVFGALEDKDIEQIMHSINGRIDKWFLATLTGERGQTAQKLADKMAAANIHGQVHCFDSTLEAYQGALHAMSEDERLVIFGSFYIAGDILAYRSQSM